MSISDADPKASASAAAPAGDRVADTVDKAASTVSNLSDKLGMKDRVQPITDAANRAADRAPEIARDTAAGAWDVAQQTRDRAAEIAKQGSEQAQRLGNEVVQRTQDQPVVVIVTALSAGILIGFALSMGFRSR
jgi:hypothetical protein